jgi:hypothetical protein
MAVQAQNLDTIGVTLLQTVTTNVNGAGIRVAQPEANNGPTTTNWEVNLSSFGQLTGFFTYYSSGGSATTFPNSLGAESGHADAVGDKFLWHSQRRGDERRACGQLRCELFCPGCLLRHWSHHQLHRVAALDQHQ